MILICIIFMVKYSEQYVNNAWLHPVLAAWAMITQLIFNYYVTEWPAPVSPRLKQQVSLSQILHSHIQIHSICNTPIPVQLSFCANNCIEDHCFKMLTLQAKPPVGIMNHYQLLIVIYKHSLSLLLSVKSRRDTGGTRRIRI